MKKKEKRRKKKKKEKKGGAASLGFCYLSTRSYRSSSSSRSDDMQFNKQGQAPHQAKAACMTCRVRLRYIRIGCRSERGVTWTPRIDRHRRAASSYVFAERRRSKDERGTGPKRRCRQEEASRLQLKRRKLRCGPRSKSTSAFRSARSRRRSRSANVPVLPYHVMLSSSFFLARSHDGLLKQEDAERRRKTDRTD